MTRTSHSRHPALSPSRPLALSLLLFALIGLPDPLPAAPPAPQSAIGNGQSSMTPPAADFYVIPPAWMGIAEGMTLDRVEVPTASLPLAYIGRDPSHPTFALVAFASLPADLLAPGRQDGIGLSGAPDSLQFVMSAATDSRGNQWFGCEDSGVFCYSPATSKWRQFTTKDGLGDDNAYALAVDHLGRIWVGHLNHGLSVYVPSPSKQEPGLETGTWKNYEVVAGLSRPDTLAGPLGERIFDIAVAPYVVRALARPPVEPALAGPQVVPTSVGSGDVWIATSAGLARYSTNNDAATSPALSPSPTPALSFESGHWSYYTRANGLPSDQAQSLAFDPDGTLYVGTQCDGIAIASPKDNYTTWRTVNGPDRMPTTPTGTGLPTNLINDILVAKSGTIYAATTLGLAESKDRAQSWHYWRGLDYADKVKGLYGGPPKDWQEQPGAWLAEDYITCLAEAPSGNLLIGYRTRGYELVNPATGQRLAASVNPDDYVTALLPQRDGSTLIGTYGDGMRSSGPDKAGIAAVSKSAIGNEQSAITPPFPATAQPPTPAQLTAIATHLQSIPATAPTDKPLVVPLADDWSTRGDWLGRYGKYWACTTAMDRDYLWGAGAQPVGFHCQIGPHCEPGDSLRYWIHWLSTDQQRSLEMPPVYLHSRVLRGETTWDKDRRQAEHDDHGESLPLSHEGPNIYYSLNIPPGLYILSFYNTNKDGHLGDNRLRDYRFSVRPFAGQADKLIPNDPVEAGRSSRSSYVSLDGFANRPELASARQRDFWGGTYKRFLVRGPSAITIEIARNGSKNTINAGLFLDKALADQPDPYFPPVQSAIGNGQSAMESGQSAIANVLQELTSLATRNPAQWATCQPLYTQLLRTYLSDPQSSQSSAAATCLFQSHQFTPWEAIQKHQGLTTAREIEKSLRWDQKTFACTGKGRQFVQAYVAANPTNSPPPTSAPATQPAAQGMRP